MTDEIPERIREEARRLAGSWAWYSGKEDATNQIARALLAAERRGAEEALGRAKGAIIHACQEFCRCGGAGPDDPQACDVCRVYHLAIRALPLPGENDTHAALGLERTPTEREEGREGKP